VAARQTVLIRGGRSGSSAEIVLRMINDITRTAFPEPFPTIVAIGGKPSGSGAADGSSGLVDFSSLNFGLEESGAPSSSEESRYSVKHNEYGRRLSALVELLHNRYEVGFQPTTNGKKLHRISVTLTKNARERYPDAMLRYRETYSAEPQADQTQNAKYASNWRQLDSRMLAAVTSAQNLDEIGVNVSQARARDASEFVVKLGADHLTWQALPNGYRQNAVMAVIASYSAEGKPMGLVVKDIEIKQDLARVPAPEDDFVTFSLRLPVEKASTRIRVLVRDVASGRIGSQDLPQTGN